MFAWLKPIDAVLRGDLQRTDPSATGKIDFPLIQIVALSVPLAALYGASIGSFAVVSAGESSNGWMQLIASTVKAPLLFYLTLLVTFPSLYVFNALMGSRLDVLSALRLLVASIAVMVAILASLGPIIVFFAFSTPGGNQGYRFILLMIVVLSAGAGILGLHYLLRMLSQFTGPSSGTADENPFGLRPAESKPMSTMQQSTDGGLVEHSELEIVEAQVTTTGTAAIGSPRPMTSDRINPGYVPVSKSPAKSIFRVWVLVFAVVGAQMSWVLRPFVGSPDREFTWFRERTGNFFQSVYHLVWQLLGGQ